MYRFSGGRAEDSLYILQNNVTKVFEQEKDLITSMFNDAGLHQDLQKMKLALQTLMRLEGLERYKNNKILTQSHPNVEQSSIVNKKFEFFTSQTNGSSEEEAILEPLLRQKRAGDLVVDLNPGSVIKEAIIGISNIVSYPTLKKLTKRQKIQANNINYLKQAIETTSKKLDEHDKNFAQLFAHNIKQIEQIKLSQFLYKRIQELR